MNTGRGTDRHNVPVAVMKFLRILPGYKYIDHKYDTVIQAELNTYHIGNKIEEGKWDPCACLEDEIKPMHF